MLRVTNMKDRAVKIGLLGASFDTGNLGVSALAESTIHCMLHKWPKAEIALLDSGTQIEDVEQRIGEKTVKIRKMPIRFCKNILLANHFISLCAYALLFKVIRSERLRRFCGRRNHSLRSMVEMDLVADITGGDSFSDIYGMRRFILGFLRKWLILLFNKELILLPQTYGPFNRTSARIMAKHIMKRARIVYSRDRESFACSRAMLGDRFQDGRARLSPDVAFALEPRRPGMDTDSLSRIRSDDTTLIGINISGLLFSGGYTGDNMFALKTDYGRLVCAVIESLLEVDREAVIILVPHVFPPAGYEAESDPAACREVLTQLNSKYHDRVHLIEGPYDQAEAKYIIGRCDFFIGSRMHSCIAALSQNIPAIGLAYSRKFHGVFESIGLAECVADARSLDQNEVLRKVHAVFEHRDEVRAHLSDITPRIKQDALNIFKDVQIQSNHNPVETAA